MLCRQRLHGSPTRVLGATGRRLTCVCPASRSALGTRLLWTKRGRIRTAFSLFRGPMWSFRRSVVGMSAVGNAAHRIGQCPTRRVGSRGYLRRLSASGSHTSSHADERASVARREQSSLLGLPMVPLSWSRAFAWRMRQRLLDQVGTESVAGVVRRLGAVPAQFDARGIMRRRPGGRAPPTGEVRERAPPAHARRRHEYRLNADNPNLVRQTTTSSGGENFDLRSRWIHARRLRLEAGS